MAETSQKRRLSSSFEACKQIQLKLANSIAKVLIFLIRLQIVIISAAAIYIAHYGHIGIQHKTLIREAKMQLRKQNQALNSSDDLSGNLENDDNLFKKLNTPRKNNI